MAVWIHNFINALQDKPVVILHGNVRDRYIDKEGRVYDNLTNLLEYVAQALPLRFSERVIYDMVGHERRMAVAEDSQPPATEAFQPKWQNPNDELAATQPPPQRGGQKAPPSRVLANWLQLISAPTPNRLFVMYYLDKLVAYRNTYLDEEKELLLWLEKLIENITPNHRLVLVALQDTMIPLELYINAPKVRVLPIPLPDKHDRLAYFSYRLEKNELQAEELELAVDFTDGLFLHDLDAIIKSFQANETHGRLEIRRLINRYRIGEQVDHWSTLNIERLSNAMTWFVEQEGVKGQNEAIQRVVDMLTLARAGLTGMASGTSSKPRGILFFAGPTGVGKTFVAKKLAKFLFSTEEAFLRFDM
ncbi:MAG TPA: ATP-dependent Clp protease ATP-binding subunit, partial [Thioploca sp.]|nr:ATP-dependent Clp protease ATP-binding subunit [Thioploca sp.]